MKIRLGFNNAYQVLYDINTIIKEPTNNDMHIKQHRYIITGGPGAGKTSIINYLAEHGYTTMSESATEIIEQDIKNGIDKPWRARDYHSRVAKLNRQKQEEASRLHEPIVFFDRGHLDGITYILLQKRELDPDVVEFVQSSMHFFETTIFFIESLEFCEQGPARNETLEEAVEKAYHLAYNYRALGYTVIKIPVDSVKNRAEKIINFVESLHKNQ